MESWWRVGEFTLKQDYEGLWHCTFSGANEMESFKGEEHNGETAEHAICLAALNIIEKEEKLETRQIEEGINPGCMQHMWTEDGPDMCPVCMEEEEEES